jgi:acylphosphatase
MGDFVSRGFLITGRVQGVGFRWFARREALRLDLGGSVRNRSDGSVEVHVVGPADTVEEMREWLERGPPAARVDAVVESEADPGAVRRPFEVLG